MPSRSLQPIRVIRVDGHALRVAAIFCANLRRFLQGQPLAHTVV